MHYHLCSLSHFSQGAAHEPNRKPFIRKTKVARKGKAEAGKAGAKPGVKKVDKRLAFTKASSVPREIRFET
jgi:hypothetical protein